MGVDSIDPEAITEIGETACDDAGTASTGGLPRSSRYQLGAALGFGGMGEVLTARDTHLGRDVAIKRLRSDAPTADQVERFLREARIQGRLEHPAIVPVHDLATDESGQPFFAMKRLDGVTLHDVLASGDRGTWTHPRLLRAFVDACLAIEFAHTRGVVHRDLKPTNIVLGEFGEVFILDWGVARIVGEPLPDAVRSDSVDPEPAGAPIVTGAITIDAGSTKVGAVLGTPGYMPPEQVRGDPDVGPAVDIYALGCILFEILAGEPLHPRDPTSAIASTLAGLDARPSLRAPDADISPELDATCARATAAAIADRFGSARALGDAVQSYLDGDRDLALRRDLARQHLGDARAALARGDDDADRRAAMRAAGRALALDPSSADAAVLVSHLVLEPPRSPPAEVRVRIDLLDRAAARGHARLAAIALSGFVVALPIFLWIGVHDWLTFGLTYAAVAGHATALVLATRSPRPERFMAISLVLYACEVALLGRFVNPFIFGTGLAVLGVALAGTHPTMSRRSLVAAIVVYLGSVLVPWALELVGWIPASYRVDSDRIWITPPVLEVDRPIGELGIALYVVLVIGMTGVLTWRISQRRRDARDRLELHAWHLRQLLPDAPAPAS
jgi:serine/threonine-protein kinase